MKSEKKKNKFVKIVFNKYFLTIFASLLLFLFVRDDSYIDIIKMKNDLKSRTLQLEALTQATDSLKVEREKLLKDKDYLEEFARNKYKMKRDNEDIFVFIK
jgi:cell division protein FtsB